MKTFTPFFLILFFSFFGNAQDCNLLFEDFESFTSNSSTNCNGSGIYHLRILLDSGKVAVEKIIVY